MKLALSLLICTSLFLEAYSAVAREIQEGKDGKCVHKSKLYNPGDVWQENCTEMTCRKYDETQMEIMYETCGAMSPPQGCKMGPGDNSQKYPKCCPVVVCPVT